VGVNPKIIPLFYPLPQGEGKFLKSEKKILRLKGVRIYTFSMTLPRERWLLTRIRKGDS